MSVATEEQRIRNLFQRVETIEEVAGTLPEDDDRRARLLAVSRDALAEEGSVRPVIAAKILGLSEKTVRAWAAAGGQRGAPGPPASQSTPCPDRSQAPACTGDRHRYLARRHPARRSRRPLARRCRTSGTGRPGACEVPRSRPSPLRRLPLRHRRDIELERVGHGPFEIMGLIWLGILGPATGRTGSR